MNNDRYSGTILSGTYTPIVFSSSICLSGASQRFPVKAATDFEVFSAASVLSEVYGYVLALPSILETIFKTKELERIKAEYSRFIQQLDKDFDNYCDEHEGYLNDAMNSTDGINRRKAVMKDYLLQELSEQLKRSGLNGKFEEPKIERLDPRDWPINEGYNLNKEKKYNISQQSLAYQDVFVFAMSPIGFFILKPITNRIRIKKMRDAIEELKPVAELNEKQMKADLLMLEQFSIALDNIDKIYQSVLDKIKPIMKDILKALEDKYQGNVNQMPPQQADALYKIKTLLKDLCETTIISRTKDTQSVCDEVCNYSDSLSEKYNDIRETIYHSFC